MTSSDSRHVSLIFAVSAAGICSPASFILPCGKTPAPFWDAIAALGEEEWATVCEKKGFITEVSFYHWLKLFAQFLDEKVRKDNTEEFHLLIMDQASAHASLRIIDYAREHNILLYMLPPHTTHVTQPVDVGLFGPLKSAYRDAERELQLRRSNAWQHLCARLCTTAQARDVVPEKAVTMCDIPYLIHRAIRESFTPQNIKSAFRATGICPFNDRELLEQATASSKDAAQRQADEESLLDPAGDYDATWQLEDEEYELLTALEVDAADAQRVLRVPTKRRPFPKTPVVGLMRLKDYQAAAEAENKAAEEKTAEKQRKVQDRQQRREEREEEKRARAAARRAGPSKSDQRKAQGPKKAAVATQGTRRKLKAVIGGGSSAIRVKGPAVNVKQRRSEAEENSRRRLKRSADRPERFRDDDQ